MRFTSMMLIMANLVVGTVLFAAKEKTCKNYPIAGADEKTPSRAQYFTWINNTNEGATEAQTMANLGFFKYLHDQFGMVLDIYAFDAGAIDGKMFYGSIYSKRFKNQFPNGLEPMYEKAKSIGTRLGVWGGPDGFGKTKKEAQARIDMMVKLCRDYDFALFKFDQVCGALPRPNRKYFIKMMQECRKYSPDLILLNHRLNLGTEGEKYATTFLWGGKETYIDVHMINDRTGIHHRVGAIARGGIPGLKRLTEDHGVCISSCVEYWADDLILQAFNRCLILAPEIYGNPWFMPDEDLPKLARIYNLHKKYRNILVNGMALPKKYGENEVARGDANTRFVTLRNLTWLPKTFEIVLNEEIGLKGDGKVIARQYHPTEKYLGEFSKGDKVKITVEPFRSCLVMASVVGGHDIAIKGTDFNIIKDIPENDVEIDLLGKAGESKNISVIDNRKFVKAFIDNDDVTDILLHGDKTVNISFYGQMLKQPYHRKLGDLSRCEFPGSAKALYEASCFAADSNALEIRALERSGKTEIPAVKAARDAFLNQPLVKERGLWDKFLFDGDKQTSFYVDRRKYAKSKAVNGGVLRVDFGENIAADKIIVRVPDIFSLQPFKDQEAYYCQIAADLKNWKKVAFRAGLESVILIPKGEKIRYFSLHPQPLRPCEVELWKDGKKLNTKKFRASNLFSNYSDMKFKKSWSVKVVVNEALPTSYLCIAVNGKHGDEGAYAAVKMGNKFIGANDRAVSYKFNAWENKSAFTDSNYTYFVPVTKDMIGKELEVFVLGNAECQDDIKPEVWITAPAPLQKKRLVLKK